MDYIQNKIINLYNTIENAADPRTKNLWLMASPLYPISIVTIYLLLIYFLPFFMKSRPAYDLKIVVRFYNLVQIVLNIIMCYWTFTSAWTSINNWSCNLLIDYSNNKWPMRMALSVWFACMVKVIDFIETIFFLFRKKNNQVSFLHVYHHVNMFLLAWIATRYIAGGSWTIFIPINGFVHILMYIYYFLSSFGPKIRKMIAPWKRRLTALQLIQFGVYFVLSIYGIRPSCKFQAKYMAILFLPTLAVFTKQFWDFYKINYIKNKSA